MPKTRVFLAINLPCEIRKRLLEEQKQGADSSIWRWTKEENLHITLVFMGYLDDEQMLETCQIARQIAEKYDSFEIKLNRICLGPPGRALRMIWVQGEKNQDLFQLKNELEEGLLGFKDSRPYAPHITLARIRPGEWNKLSKQALIEKEVNLSFEVGSIEVMQSNLSRQGAEYSVFESILLK